MTNEELQKKAAEKAAEKEAKEAEKKENKATAEAIAAMAKELAEMRTKVAALEAEKKESDDIIYQKGKNRMRIVDPKSDPAGYRQLIANYANQNPVKYAAKKAELERKLNQ